jgi:hypothetical protein
MKWMLMRWGLHICGRLLEYGHEHAHAIYGVMVGRLQKQGP